MENGDTFQKAAPFPWLFITASSGENFIITGAVLYLLESHTVFTLPSLEIYKRLFGLFFQAAVMVSGTKDVLLDWKHFTTQKGKSWTENISDSSLDAVQRYCGESSDRWSDNWRQRKMRESQEQERLWGETASWSSDTAAEKRRGRGTGRRTHGGQNNWIINEKDAF